jgi:hypothetical protein
MFKRSIAILLLFAITSCATKKQENMLQEGDLLFQDLNCGALCNAIETVTEGIDGKKFSHCAMIVKQNDTLKVVEAIGGNVQTSTLHHFFARSGDTATIKNITIARTTAMEKVGLAKAVSFAVQQVGQPYDDEFIMNNGKWYCSELLYEAFKVANNQKEFFSLAPMTFKDPATKNYFPAWIDYYKALQKPIPEGQLGLNPGSISRSDKLTILKIDKLMF